MGFFESLIDSSGRGAPVGERDGDWLKLAHDVDWQSIGQDHEWAQYGLSTCFNSGMGTFAIMRAFSEQLDGYAFYGCLIHPKATSVIQVIVDRVESRDGRTLRTDNWKRKQMVPSSTQSWLPQGIKKIRNTASINNYVNMPPYVAYFTLRAATLSQGDR